MKLRNKKTGEIVEVLTDSIAVNVLRDREEITGYYNSLAKLNSEWEDYEEPKEYWYIDPEGTIICEPDDEAPYDDYRKQIGNYFETKEEAEKAVERLRAWKRLKDRGFRFEGIKQDYTRFNERQAPFQTGRKYLQFNKAEDEDWLKDNWDDLALLFRR